MHFTKPNCQSHATESRSDRNCTPPSNREAMAVSSLGCRSRSERNPRSEPPKMCPESQRDGIPIKLAIPIKTTHSLFFLIIRGFSIQNRTWIGMRSSFIPDSSWNEFIHESNEIAKNYARIPGIGDRFPQNKCQTRTAVQ